MSASVLSRSLVLLLVLLLVQCWAVGAAPRQKKLLAREALSAKSLMQVERVLAYELPADMTVDETVEHLVAMIVTPRTGTADPLGGAQFDLGPTGAAASPSLTDKDLGDPLFYTLNGGEDEGFDDEDFDDDFDMRFDDDDDDDYNNVPDDTEVAGQEDKKQKNKKKFHMELPIPHRVLHTQEWKGMTMKTLSVEPGPRLFYIDDFLSRDEVEYCLKKAHQNLDRFSEPGRTGISLEMEIDSDPILKRIAQREYDLVGIPNKMHGTFRVRRYSEEHQEFHPVHTDTYTSSAGSVLLATAILYLTEPEQGGETTFVNYGRSPSAVAEDPYPSPPPYPISVKPKPGRLAVWMSCTPDGKDDHMSAHGSEPVVKGVKWTYTHFIYNDVSLCNRLSSERLIGRPEEEIKTAEEPRPAAAPPAAGRAAAGSTAKATPAPAPPAPEPEVDLEFAGGKGRLPKGRVPNDPLDPPDRVGPPLASFPYPVRNLSAMPGPRIWHVPGFLSPSETADMLGHLQKNIGRFVDTDNTGIAWEAPLAESPLVQKLVRKLELIIGFRGLRSYSVRMRRYVAGKFHPLHTDTYFDGEYQLIGTMITYLTTPPKGGQTFFPLWKKNRRRLDAHKAEAFIDVDYSKPFPPDFLEIPAVAGDMAFWFSCTPDGRDDVLSMHGSAPVVEGEKWTATYFIYADQRQCMQLSEEQDRAPPKSKRPGTASAAGLQRDKETPEGEDVANDPNVPTVSIEEAKKLIRRLAPFPDDKDVVPLTSDEVKMLTKTVRNLPPDDALEVYAAGHLKSDDEPRS